MERAERLLHTMALANQVGVPVEVSYKNNQLGFKFKLTGFHEWQPLGLTDEWVINSIDRILQEELARQKRAEYLKQVKEDLMKTLTPDQKEALGLK